MGASFLTLRRGFVRYYDAWVVLADIDAIECVPACARCLQPTTCSRREVRPSDGKSIIIPYCQTCLDSLGRRNAGHLGFSLASVLVGVAGCLFLPLVPWLSKAVAVTLALLGAALPWVFGQLWLLRVDRHGSIAPRAAYPCADGLICDNAEWARRLGHELHVVVQPRRIRVGLGLGWSAAGIIVAATVTPGLHDTFHCDTRIVNLTEDDLFVSVDGHPVALAKATTRENPLAGNIVRIPAGSRRLEARQRDGSLVHESLAKVVGGQAYLYAPGHPSTVCFWIERTAFGRARANPLAKEYLPAHMEFWELPVTIDNWFAPALGPKTALFTGGVVTSLRQGSCEPKNAQ